jgi:hypothetical protein
VRVCGIRHGCPPPPLLFDLVVDGVLENWRTPAASESEVVDETRVVCRTLLPTCPEIMGFRSPYEAASGVVLNMSMVAVVLARGGDHFGMERSICVWLDLRRHRGIEIQPDTCASGFGQAQGNVLDNKVCITNLRRWNWRMLGGHVACHVSKSHTLPWLIIVMQLRCPLHTGMRGQEWTIRGKWDAPAPARSFAADAARQSN